MSRFILGDCVQVMSRFPARAVDFILTDPPYLVGYKDRTGRTLAGDNSAEWLQPACHEMYRVLKNDSLMVSFYAWNRADLFLNAWKAAGFRVVGEACPLPLTIDVQAELFPEVMHTRTGRRLHRSGIKTTRQMRRQSREYEQRWKLRQNLLEQAKIDLNFQSPETVCTWYTRWSDEFDAAELAAPFWRWQSRFASLKELDWLRISGEPLYAVMYEIPFIVRETAKHVRVAERWQVPNKLADRSGV
ncbi:plasmid SOS inhibition protein A [Enterobacter roggenkampii]|uniref:plasmid SOS inhibition protein A n=1 Tax=Enterobacter roggenkampii TaxID=1812935 RepID=UPI000BA84DE0|nr:plasmid SOS inhibition protein A [Enterobacter roggenkampii]PAO19193.1 hypothetical protein CIW56_21810 [Enterobacter roggenkampii]